MLFNEPKLLKCGQHNRRGEGETRFSALQRAEIAEMMLATLTDEGRGCFSALQRAEIAEIVIFSIRASGKNWVSVLFNEPKLLKWDEGIVVFFVKREFQCSSTSRNC